MFGGSTQQQQPQSQLQPPTATETTTPAEEESLKRNTDCVYFLASPLTCKKGSECEYRHSDVTRVNPTDCWYWLNGNCLNPKCTFRHPPLDGLLGIQVSAPTPVGPPQAAATTPVGTTHVSGKQGVPCIFFRKGFCLKGDRCPFFHAPPWAPNKVPQLAGATPPVNVSLNVNKAFVGLEKTTTKEQKVPRTNVPKTLELPLQVKPVVRVETALSKNGVATDKYAPPSSAVDDELRRYRLTNVHATQGDSINRSNRVVQPHVSEGNCIPNEKEVDEFSREPSPGFDVLVDDELRDSDYYPNEDQFGNSNPLNDYDIGRSADYNSMADVDRDLHHDPNGYDSYEHVRGQQYAWEEDGVLIKRKLGRQGRKRHPRVDSPDPIDESDLRYRLAKQRRGNNGLRSVISRDHARDNSDGDQSHRAPQRDSRRLSPLEISVSKRLRGRIKIPGRSASPDSRELERGRNWGRLSPGRPLITFHHGKLRDRINGRVEGDFNNLRGSRMRRDVINDNNKSEFNGPKRLTELKVVKNVESDRSSLVKRKFPKAEDHHQQSEGDLSFEGPKPLSEILKRKRGSESNEDGHQKQIMEKLKDEANQVQSMKEKSKSVSSVINTENVKPMEGGQSSLKHNVSVVGSKEEGMIGEEAMEGHEGEAYDRKEGGSEEEPVDEEEDYNIEGAENEEYVDDEDADDFAKKMGVMYS